jgi:hypothetical protein
MSALLRSDSKQLRNSALRRSFLKCLPKIMRVADYAFRHHRSVEREEHVAETVAWTWTLFVQAGRRGKDPSEFPTALAKFAVKHVRSGRCLGQPKNSKELYAACTPSERRCLVSLDEVEPQSRTPWKEIIVESRAFSPADAAALRIDVDSWMNSLPRRDRRIAEKLARGERTGCVARAFRISPARISQLRDEFRRSWERFQNYEDCIKNRGSGMQLAPT